MSLGASLPGRLQSCPPGSIGSSLFFVLGELLPCFSPQISLRAIYLCGIYYVGICEPKYCGLIYTSTELPVVC